MNSNNNNNTTHHNHYNESNTLLFIEECEIVVEIIENFRIDSYETKAGYQFSCLFLIVKIGQLQEKLLRALDGPDRKWKIRYCWAKKQLKQVQCDFYKLEAEFSDSTLNPIL
jgi:hypothetical protein